MSLRVGHLTKDERTARLVQDGNGRLTLLEDGAPGKADLHVTYRPSTYTHELIEELEELAEQRFQSAAYMVVLPKLVTKWDLLEDDDLTPVPLTEERLAKLPLIFLDDVFDAIRDDAEPGRAEGNEEDQGSPSDGRSTSQQGSENHQETSIERSEQPATST